MASGCMRSSGGALSQAHGCLRRALQEGAACMEDLENESELAARLVELERRAKASVRSGIAGAAHCHTAAGAALASGQAHASLGVLWHRLGPGRQVPYTLSGEGTRHKSADGLLNHLLKVPDPSDGQALYAAHADPKSIGAAMAKAAMGAFQGMDSAGLVGQDTGIFDATESQQLLFATRGGVHSVVNGATGKSKAVIGLMRSMWDSAGGGCALRLESGAPHASEQGAAAFTRAQLVHAELLATATALASACTEGASAEELERELAQHAARGVEPTRIVVFVSRPCCSCCRCVLAAIAKKYRLSIRVLVAGTRSWHWPMPLPDTEPWHC